MKFDVYYATRTRTGVIRPGVKPHPMEWSEIKRAMGAKANIDLIDRFRNGDKDAKPQLPAVCFVGTCMKTRANSFMMPTQAVMIDVDHVENPTEAFNTIKNECLASEDKKKWWFEKVLLWAITPSGKGLRGVIWAQEGLPDVMIDGILYNEHDLPCQMDYLNRTLNLSKYGDFDAPCKDFARISFFFKPDEVLFENAQLLTEYTKKPEGIIVNLSLKREPLPMFEGDDEKQKANVAPSAETSSPTLPTFTKEEEEELTAYDYCGTPLSTIINKWVETYGKPGKAQVHNYYNDMIKNFRNIANNDKRVLFYLLPRFGHSPEECWSQIESICRVNTLSSLPKTFYFFLKDNGYYRQKNVNGSLAEFMLQDDAPKPKMELPWLPPVFKELLGTAPEDFKIPLMNGLLPIIGTLTSHVGATYYYGKNEYHTTSFFSVIYAPAATGKGFIADYMNMLFEKIKTRDFVMSAREQLYLSEMGKKGANDKAPDDPHTQLRIIFPKNSEAEFLQKQKDNHGYHMFTYAAEMDSWAKGVKAAGGNKDDMLRIAWDNGEYGQNFKSANTVKGGTKLYWNVLITGTLPQVQNYFKNVENGLVTRTSFCSIENQEFAEPPKWRALTPKQREVIRKFVERCDNRTYEEPCTLLPSDIEGIGNAKKFDDEVDWHFKFRPRQTVDMEWLHDTIKDWLAEQLKKAAKDFDKARDVFRRRAAVRGFRLGMICTQLWESPRQSDLKKCCPFIKWWMDADIENMMKLWGKVYNEVAQDEPQLQQKSLYTALPSTFDKNDIMAQCMKAGIKTPVRIIVFNWKKFGFVRKEGKKFIKTKKDG